MRQFFVDDTQHPEKHSEKGRLIKKEQMDYSGLDLCDA